MDRTKNRISDLDTRIKGDAGNVGRLEDLRLATKRLRELSLAVEPDLAGADWHRRREIIRTLVQRIDIDTSVIRVIFRVTQTARGLNSDSNEQTGSYSLARSTYAIGDRARALTGVAISRVYVMRKLA